MMDEDSPFYKLLIKPRLEEDERRRILVNNIKRRQEVVGSSDRNDMIVLSLDLDFFQSKTVLRSWGDEGDRPSPDKAEPWEEKQVREYLEACCRLDSHAPVPGVFRSTHDQMVPFLDGLLKQKRLRAPFTMVHVDAHADLGHTDSGWSEVFGKITSAPSNQKIVLSTKLHEANVVLYCLAYGWIRNLIWVQIAAELDYISTDQVHPFCFRSVYPFDPPGPPIELPIMTPEVVKRYTGWTLEYWTDWQKRTKPVPFTILRPEELKFSRKPDFVFFCHSPKYSVEKTDKLLPTILEYIELEEVSGG